MGPNIRNANSAENDKDDTAVAESSDDPQRNEPQSSVNSVQQQQPRESTSSSDSKSKKENTTNKIIENASSDVGGGTQEQQPWYFPSLLGRAAEFMDSPTPSECVVSQHEREDEDRDRGQVSKREEEEDPCDSQGGKREREEGRDDSDGDNSQGRKRRRVVEESSLAFYDNIHSSSEEERIIFENTAAGSYFVLIKLMPSLGFNAFAARWAFIVFLGHTLQAALTNFQNHSGCCCLMPFIPADGHVWMDNCLWNQPLVTCMLLYPNWFAEGPAPIWLACIIIPVMLADNLISLKDDYLCHKPHITIPSYQRSIEAGFLDIAVSMTISFVLIVISQVWSVRWILWIGLVFFNIPPAYFLWAHRQRIQYGILMSAHAENRCKHGSMERISQGMKVL